MSTYKKNEAELETSYLVPIDYYLDETPAFNGDYLKNKDGALVYFGLQNIDGDYSNNLSNKDLTNCFIISDDNYTIKLEKVDNTAAKIFINKPKNILTLNNRHAYVTVYYKDNISNNKTYMFTLTFYPQMICTYTHIFSVQNFISISKPSFSFNQLYFVINYNGTGGLIDIAELKKANTFDISSDDLNKKILAYYNPDTNIDLYINKLIYTYYSYYVVPMYIWTNENGYIPTDFISNGYDKLYNMFVSYGKYFDYSQNKISDSNAFNKGKDHTLYFCAINESNNQVVPVYKISTYFNDRSQIANGDTYTTYIVK